MHSLLPNKMKKKIPHCQKSSKIIETVAEWILLTHIHNSLLSEVGTGTSIKTWRGFTSFMGPNLSSY